MYMSYCMYEGTKMELRRCLADVDDHVSECAEYAVSEREISEFKDMVNTFYEWMVDNALITLDGELDRDALEKIGEAMATKQEEEEYEEY